MAQGFVKQGFKVLLHRVVDDPLQASRCLVSRTPCIYTRYTRVFRPFVATKVCQCVYTAEYPSTVMTAPPSSLFRCQLSIHGNDCLQVGGRSVHIIICWSKYCSSIHSLIIQSYLAHPRVCLISHLILFCFVDQISSVHQVSVFLSIYLSGELPVYVQLSIHPSTLKFTCQSAYCLDFSLSIYQSLFTCDLPSVYPAVCPLIVHPSVHMSMCPSSFHSCVCSSLSSFLFCF